MAQRWGWRDSYFLVPFLEKRAGFERQSHYPLEPVLGRMAIEI
jgi:hypothetical protein